MNVVIIMYIWGIIQTVACLFTGDSNLGITANIWIVGGILYTKIENTTKENK